MVNPGWLLANQPLTAEQKKHQDDLINKAEQASREASQMSERLRRAAKLYRERLTGRVEKE